jgi:uncharacterized protein (TIGR00255 family)
MTKSMTGYGRAESFIDGKRYFAEIKSVNHRYLEVSLRLPNLLLPLELEIKKRISERLYRGRIDVFIKINQNGVQENEAKLELNLPLIRNYYNLLLQIKQEFDLKDKITLGMISGLRDAFILSEEGVDISNFRERVQHVLDEAVTGLVEMREKEGQSICQDLLLRIGIIDKILDAIKFKAPCLLDHYQKRLSDRVKELMGGIEVDENRLAQEVAIMAEKSDVTEEVVRLKSHIHQFHAMLNSDETVGRKIDFLIQEMYREINTLGSKSCDEEISKWVIEIKSELAKLREQGQNIE